MYQDYYSKCCGEKVYNYPDNDRCSKCKCHCGTEVIEGVHMYGMGEYKPELDIHWKEPR